MQGISIIVVIISIILTAFPSIAVAGKLLLWGMVFIQIFRQQFSDTEWKFNTSNIYLIFLLLAWMLIRAQNVFGLQNFMMFALLMFCYISSFKFKTISRIWLNIIFVFVVVCSLVFQVIGENYINGNIGALITLILSALMYIYFPKRRVSIIILALITIIMYGSRSVILSFGLSLMVIFCVTRLKIKLGFIMAALTITIGATIYTYWDLMMSADFNAMIFEKTGKNFQSGRNLIWGAIFDYMKGVIDYCCQDKKVYDEISNQRLVSGVNCDGENAFAEFLATKKSYKKTDGMNFYQYVQSFSPEENITPQKAHEVALEFAERAWTGYEVLVATHCDVQHTHSHFVINSVSFENGKKLRQNPNTLNPLRALSDEICRQHNLSTLESYSKNGIKISTREYRTAVKGQSWKFKLMNDIDKAMNISGSKEDFINAMSIMGYSVTWTDDRKYITYQCPNKMKCRDIKLHNEKYLKGSMENEFRYRQEQYFRKSQTEEQQLTDGDRTTIGRKMDHSQ